MLTTTIAAISTPRGRGGVAMIRISGHDALSVADKCFLPLSGKQISEYPARHAVTGKVMLGGRAIDTAVAVSYEAGRSFTGESTVELTCHGGVYVTGEVLSAVYAAGAVPAMAGEFTRRAFLNGKLTLTEAEALGQLIDADTASKASLARGAMNGALSRRIDALAEKLTAALAALYAAIDYPDEDLSGMTDGELAETLKTAASGIDALLATYKTGHAVSAGVETVICGKPNSGKSTLFNALCGEQRAIVTDIAGTTRDILEAAVDFGGVTLKLYDTAGLHASSDTIEKLGIQKACEKIKSASLIIAVFDAGEAYDSSVFELCSGCAPIISVINKSDLPQRLTDEDIQKINENSRECVRACLTEGLGIDGLAAAVSRMFESDIIDVSCDAVIWDSRHRAALESARELIESALAALSENAPTDAVCSAAEAALGELCKLDRRSVTEAIVNSIFEKFCVGK